MLDKIADFMLSRWGTWVHAGGYPLYRVWHQNGTTEEWGEDGFKTLMSHIGKGNVGCWAPPDSEDGTANFDLDADQSIGVSWRYWDGQNLRNIQNFEKCNIGRPLKLDDFKEYLMMQLFETTYEGKTYLPGAVIRFCADKSAFDFGVYIHLGAWKSYDGNGQVILGFEDDFPMGLISTALAICNEFSYASHRLYCRMGDSATETIQKAETEGRIVGLAEAKTSFQNAIDAFAAGNYKLAAAYANQATQTAENATAPASNNLQIIAIIVTVGTAISIGIYYRINNKNKS